jgi:hypothetical protein
MGVDETMGVDEAVGVDETMGVDEMWMLKAWGFRAFTK